MVTIPRLRQSFCGCTLETSSMIIAWLGVLGSAFQLLLGACLFGVFYDYMCDEMIKKDMSDQQLETAMLSIRVSAAVMFVIYSASLAIDTMLLVGIHKKNHCLMTPWIILCGAGCALGMLAVVITFFAAFVYGGLLVIVFLLGPPVAFGVYCFLVVYSYYAQIKEERLMNDVRFKPLE
ncbi:unnamed protein product [Nezara viridula]|uniref:Uncharacterized protein n=2 Tax=Nezara viridula TaxID=85310 RepID=A0A9P0DZQ4_NEZVI|nr:unnamed protein product [Nezara viridula]